MRFFVDENETDAILPPLRATFLQHEFRGSKEEELGGIDDIPLFAIVAERGFDALITRDSNQLDDRDERRALIESGLHWIGHKQPGASGELGIALTSAAYMAAMPHIVSALPTVEQPHAFHVKGLASQEGQRVKIRKLQAPS